MSFNVIKRNGSLAEYDPSKINMFVEYVCEGISGVSMSDIIMNAKLKLSDGVKTEDINKILIQSAEDLISIESPNYDLVAGRMLISEIRKNAYGEFDPPHLYYIIKENVILGKYDNLLLEHYTKEEINELNNYIVHDRDYNISISGAREWADKYIIQDRINKTYFESPQVAYMVSAMANFIFDEGNEKYSRIEFIKKRYDHLSLGLWNSPTPQNAGMRTPTRNYSSCVLIETDDSIDGIAATEFTGKRYATLKAGLGIGSQNLRGKGRPIRNGDAINTGVLSHAKSIEESVLSCSQGGLRKGSMTFNWLGWHIDYDNIVRFKNNARLDSDSMKHSDHSIHMNGEMLRRVVSNEDIYLFSPEQTRDLVKLFYSSDREGFAKLYEELGNSDKVESKRINAREWFSTFVSERFGTGRIYTMFADNANKYGPFIDSVAPITMSNLCQEITQHTLPVKFSQNDDFTLNIDGLIALCNLGGINWGAFDKKEDFEEVAYVGVRALDNLLSLQNYPFNAARKHNAMYRPIGIGITGLAYWLAKNDLKYDNCYELLDEWADYWSYCITKASVELAKERGACDALENTKWSKGLFKVDYVPEAVNEIVQHKVRQHWEDLRPDLIKYGIRNATLMAAMPAETSAKISGRGTTNGIEPIRSLVVSKGGKSSKGKFVVPELTRLKDKYDIVWEWTDSSALIKVCAVLQKYIDQAISVNTYYNKNNYPDGKIPFNVVAQDILDHYSYGGKTLYYNNNNDDNTSAVEYENGSSTTTVVVQDDNQEDDYCESCTL